MSGIRVWAAGIGDELRDRLPGQRKTQRDKLALLVATMLHVRSATLVELASGLPRPSDRWDMGYQWISRFLGNARVCCDTIMAPFATEMLSRSTRAGGAVPLILDQSKLSDRHQVLMLGVRWGERALPVAWRVVATQGAIGFETQKELLEAVRPWLPPGTGVIPNGDRFYGTPALIRLCQGCGWDYRLRLKGNLVARVDGQRTTTGELAQRHDRCFEAVALTEKRVVTTIGILRDPGHDEPWIIAMAAKPGYLTTLDYSKRWGIEPMFSDFKSRGFGIEQTQIHHPDRVGRLILVMALALYWSVSTGMWDEAENPLPVEKNAGSPPQEGRPKPPVLVRQGAEESHKTDAAAASPTKTLDHRLKLMDVQITESVILR